MEMLNALDPQNREVKTYFLHLFVLTQTHLFLKFQDKLQVAACSSRANHKTTTMCFVTQIFNMYIVLLCLQVLHVTNNSKISLCKFFMQSEELNVKIRENHFIRYLLTWKKPPNFFRLSRKDQFFQLE